MEYNELHGKQVVLFDLQPISTLHNFSKAWVCHKAYFFPRLNNPGASTSKTSLLPLCTPEQMLSYNINLKEWVSQEIPF